MKVDTSKLPSRSVPTWLWPVLAVAVGLLIAGFFAYGWWDAQGLRRDSGVFPTFLARLGLGLMLLVVVEASVRWFLGRRDGRTEPAGDAPPDEELLSEPDGPTADMENGEAADAEHPAFAGVEPAGVVRAFLAITVMVLGTMLIGFHLTIPTFVVAYSALWGGVRSWWKLLLTWVVFLLGIVIVYGYFMNTPWPRSWLEEWLGRDMQRLLMPYVRPLLEMVGL